MIHMMSTFIGIALAVAGASLGSFTGATVWRLRARQLLVDKKAGEAVDADEYARLLPLTKRSFWSDRSIDLDTGRQLEWYDMLPVVSWLLLRGKSRYSGKPIGRFEFLIELGMMAFFIVSYVAWPTDLSNPYAIVQFIVWLIAGVLLGILFAYDAKWFLLPDIITFGLIVAGVVFVAMGFMAVGGDSGVALISNILISVAILSGVYYVLYLVSRGAWIGFGDIKLGIGLALFVIDWQLAFLTLFLANLLGTLWVLPAMIRRRLSRHAHVPFGPFLIVSAVISVLWGEHLLSLYTSVLF